jgi:hypothetical protein
VCEFGSEAEILSELDFLEIIGESEKRRVVLKIWRSRVSEEQ